MIRAVYPWSSLGAKQFRSMAGGGNRMSPEAIVQARERERQVLQLFLHGLHWVEIGRQLGMTCSIPLAAY